MHFNSFWWRLLRLWRLYNCTRGLYFIIASSLISKYINDMLPKLESTCLTTTDLMLKAQKESCNNSISIQKFSGFSRQSENTIYFAISKLLTFGKKNVSGRVRFRIRMGINFWDCIAQTRREIDKVWEIVWERGTLKIHAILFVVLYYSSRNW